MKNFPRFYLIVDDVSWLPRFLPLGLKLLQLRIKDKPEEEIVAQITRAKSLCKDYGCQRVINDYWHPAIAQ